MVLASDHAAKNGEHPLTVYLRQSGLDKLEFANRVCISLACLDEILAFRYIPELSLIRRIIVETDNFLDVNDFFVIPGPQNKATQLDADDRNSTPVRIVEFRGQKTNDELDIALLNDVFVNIYNELIDISANSCKSGGDHAQTFRELSEATSNTYCALSRITSHQGRSRLSQALQPAIVQILAMTKASLCQSQCEALVPPLTQQAIDLYLYYQHVAARTHHQIP